MRLISVFAATAIICFAATSINAAYVTVNLGPVANELDNRIQNMPVGMQTLGGVPFDLLPMTANNSWSADVGTTLGVQSTEIMTLPVSIFGATAVDTLINTGWGVDGSTTDSLTFVCTDATSFTVLLKEGTDIRDWLNNTSSPYSNTINGTTSTQVFDGIPNAAGGPDGRIDKQTITLPSAFASRTLSTIVLTDTGVSGNDDAAFSHSVGAQRAFVYGVTVTTVPEPTSEALMAFGCLLCFAVLRQQVAHRTLESGLAKSSIPEKLQPLVAVRRSLTIKQDLWL